MCDNLMSLWGKDANIKYMEVLFMSKHTIVSIFLLPMAISFIFILFNLMYIDIRSLVSSLFASIILGGFIGLIILSIMALTKYLNEK